MHIPEPDFTNPIAAANLPVLADLLLSRGKYFIASKVDKSIAPEAGQAPFSLNIAGSYVTVPRTAASSWSISSA